MTDGHCKAVREVEVPNEEGLHARPVTDFVDLASSFQSTISVMNLSGRKEEVDGKSPIEMMFLEAIKGSVLRITACGEDAQKAVDALAVLVSTGTKPASGQGHGVDR